MGIGVVVGPDVDELRAFELEANVQAESAGLVVGRGMHDVFVYVYTHIPWPCLLPSTDTNDHV